MPPTRPASGDTIYVMYAYGKVTIIVSRCWPASTTNQRPGDLDLLTVSESRVTCATSANFGLPGPLCFRLKPEERDRQTDVRQHHRLMPPEGHN